MSRARPAQASLLVLALACGCAWIHPTEPQQPLAEDVRIPDFVEIPVDFAHRWDRALGHHLTGGAAIDVDADGRHELFVGGGEGQPDALLAYRDGRLVDEIAGTGLSSLRATHGAAAIDLDADGDVDLAVCRSDGVTLYLRDGAGFRPQRLEVSLPEDAVPLAVAATDLEGDGDVDLYLSLFVDFPHFRAATFNVPSHAKANRLLRNDGDLQFTDVTDEVTASRQNTFTSAFVDLDGDALQELVIAQNTGEVEILRHRPDGRFERVPVDSGYGFWMGVAVGDQDADGDPDLLFTNVGDTFPGFLARGDLRDDQRLALGWLLLRNDGGLRFTDVTRDVGIAGLGFAWGAVFEDVNLDGRLDLLVSQNYVKWPVHRVFKFPGKVLLGQAAGMRLAAASVAPNHAYSNAPLLADLDGDARLDLFWLNNDGPSRAYLNRTPGNAVIVALPDSVRALGARARLDGGDTRTTREVVSGAGLGVDPAPWLVLGIGESTRPGRLVVTWPDGSALAIADPPLNRPIHIR